MNLKSLIVAAALAGSLNLTSTPARAEDPVQTMARKLHAEKQDSVVWISAVLKMSATAEGNSDTPMNIPDQERKVEALGTILDSSGLIVTAMSQLDPSRELAGREINTPKGPVKLDVTVTLKEVKIVMPDGTEIPAEQVMKDVDLDLAFLRIKTDSKEAKGITFKALDFKDSGTVKISDDAITLSRTEESLNRVAAVTRGQIISITEKPRKFLRVSSAMQGCPTFNLDGKVVGLGVQRFVKSKGSVAVVIPAADVLEIADQARAAKPAAK